MDSFFDPFDDSVIDALEDAIERSVTPGPPLTGQLPFLAPDHYTDSICQQLDSVEASIEDSIVHPPEPTTPLPLLPPPQPLASPLGPVSKGPPHTPDRFERPFVMMQPPREATPFLTSDGLNRPTYRPRGGRGAGSRHGSPVPMARLCPESLDEVDEETCQSCGRFGTWSEESSEDECYYDWLDRETERQLREESE